MDLAEAKPRLMDASFGDEAQYRGIACNVV